MFPRRSLRLPERLGWLDKPQIHGLKESGCAARGAKEIRHQGPVPGAQLHQTKGRRSAHLHPDRRKPGADQFSEHLTDEGRCDEVSAFGVVAERRPGGVVAFRRIMKAQVHVLGHADRAARPDHGGDPCGQTHRTSSPGGWFIPLRMSQPPNTAMGRLRIIPIVRPRGKSGM